MAKVMLINAAQPEEIRVAILERGSLHSFFVERKGKAQAAGNIYRGRAVNVEPSLQAAFVDLGVERHGFLHASDVIAPDGGHADVLGRSSGNGAADRKSPGRRGRSPPAIEKMLSRGQDVLVQITKEGLGTKGAALTTYISLPGKYLVLMPGLSRLGVSKKIEDEATRRRLKKLLGNLKAPEGMGVIIRTAGSECGSEDLQRDLDHLLRLWGQIRSRVRASKAPSVIYQEGDLVIRAIRDNLTPDIREIVIDDAETCRKAREFLAAVSPGGETRCRHYRGTTPLFHKYKVEDKLERLFDRRVELKSGTSIIIEQTEAMVTIDVNSGRFRKKGSNIQTILHANLQAAAEIGRQLRLRDVGGLIMIDFIDMDDLDHRRQVEEALAEALAGDKARTRLCSISPLGVLEMTRQRVRPSLQGTLYAVCPQCGGSGHVRSRESTGLDFIRVLRAAAQKAGVRAIQAKLAPETALHIANKYRKILSEIEQDRNMEIDVQAGADLRTAEIRLYTLDENGKASLFDA